MAEQRAYLVTYDISDGKRLSRTARVLEGYGFRIQESVFYCKLSALMKESLASDLSSVVNKTEDQCVLIDLGPDVDAIESFETIGRPIPAIPRIIFV